MEIITFILACSFLGAIGGALLGLSALDGGESLPYLIFVGMFFPPILFLIIIRSFSTNPCCFPRNNCENCREVKVKL